VWTAGLAVEILGVRIGLRCDDVQLLHDATERLPPLWRACASPVVDSLFSIRAGGPGKSRGVSRYYLLYEGAVPVARTRDRQELLDRVASTVDLTVAERTTERLFVHAGVVGWRGCGILIPGPTFTGKTSLVTALLSAGATYYSDDCALLDEKGRVHPYPKPLAIREQGTARQRSLSPEEMGATIGGEPLPVRLIAFTHYVHRARWRPRRLSPAQALLALLEYTSAVRSRPLAAMEILGRAIGGATVLAGARGEAAETAALLLDSAAARLTPPAKTSQATL
jgi:hypothetical protein